MNTGDIKITGVYSIFGKKYGDRLINSLTNCCNSDNAIISLKNGLTKTGNIGELGGAILHDTEVYFNTPDSTHMGATFLPNGVVSLPAPTLLFGERTNDGNVNGIAVVNIPSTLYFTQIGYKGREIGRAHV